jgi:hypothetical protein
MKMPTNQRTIAMEKRVCSQSSKEEAYQAEATERSEAPEPIRRQGWGENWAFVVVCMGR